MDNQEIDEMLNRYYMGESSAEEERLLKELMLGGDLPEKYDLEREMFAGFEEGDDIPEPSDGFEQAIMARIDHEEDSLRSRVLRRRFYSTVSVAASLLIIISSYFILLTNSGPDDTFTDPDLAYIETMQVLRMVSEGLNSGKNQLSDLAYINQAYEKIEMIGNTSSDVTRQLEPLSYINRGINIIGTLPGVENEVN